MKAMKLSLGTFCLLLAYVFVQIALDSRVNTAPAMVSVAGSPAPAFF